MPSKKDNLPLNVEKDMEATGAGTITYANEVIAIIAGVATSEVEGIAGMSAIGGISDILGRNRNITKGVKVELGTEETSVDLYIIVEYGTPIQKAAHDAQENVRKAIETMTGLRVVRVDVHVQGVSFEKENKALEKGQQNAALASGEVFKKVTGNKAEPQESTPAAVPVTNAPVELIEDKAAEKQEDLDRDIEEPEDDPDLDDIQEEEETPADQAAAGLAEEPKAEEPKADEPEAESPKAEPAGEEKKEETQPKQE